ncbi:MAG: hypothetical protein J5I90_16640 [Caldilineales bacterium]|nr:hypothetical protein [Caldilineales bacterium]
MLIQELRTNDVELINSDKLPMLEEEARERQRGGQGGILLSQKIDQANDIDNGKAAQQAAAIVGTNGQFVAGVGRLRNPRSCVTDKKDSPAGELNTAPGLSEALKAQRPGMSR